MIDYTRFFTFVPNIINRVYDFVVVNFANVKAEKGWTNFLKFSNSLGIDIYFRKNRFGEMDKMFICFSPHIIFNNERHNANYLSYDNALQTIINVFYSLQIKPEEICELGISFIELGVNFPIKINANYVLDSALMIGKNFWKSKFPHFKYWEPEKKFDRVNAKQDKHLKFKFYIKSEQKKTVEDKCYYELGYCEENVMRFEIQLQRANNISFKGKKLLNFKNASVLFEDFAKEKITNFILFHFDKVFFFSLQDIDKKKLKHENQKKRFYQWQVENYWKTLSTRTINTQKKYYNNTPKIFDLKSNIYEALKSAIFQQNNSSKILSKKFDLKNTANNYQQRKNNILNLPTNNIDIVKSTTYTIEKRYCIITGIDISEQRKGSRFLRETTLKKIKIFNPKLFEELKNKYSEPNYNELTEYQQLNQICKHLRNGISNPKHSRLRFERMTYHPNQLQFF